MTHGYDLSATIVDSEVPEGADPIETNGWWQPRWRDDEVCEDRPDEPYEIYDPQWEDVDPIQWLAEAIYKYAGELSDVHSTLCSRTRDPFDEPTDRVTVYGEPFDPSPYHALTVHPALHPRGYTPDDLTLVCRAVMTIATGYKRWVPVQILHDHGDAP